MPEAQISYTTVLEEPRTGPVGRAMRWIGAHPVLAGLCGGLIAVLIAVVSSFEGVRNAPVDALIISAIVVVVWIVLFYFLSSFFARQAIRRFEVRRDIEADDDLFRWLEANEERVRIEAPTYRLYSTDVPEHMLEARSVDQPWPVWLVVSGEDTRFVMETKITAGEAAHYDEVPDEVIEATDEELPTTLASPLLSCADRAAGDDTPQD